MGDRQYNAIQPDCVGTPQVRTYNGWWVVVRDRQDNTIQPNCVGTPRVRTYNGWVVVGGGHRIQYNTARLLRVRTYNGVGGVGYWGTYNTILYYTDTVGTPRVRTYKGQ